jgi:hypothetical protein
MQDNSTGRLSCNNCKNNENNKGKNREQLQRICLLEKITKKKRIERI